MRFLIFRTAQWPLKVTVLVQNGPKWPVFTVFHCFSLFLTSLGRYKAVLVAIFWSVLDMGDVKGARESNCSAGGPVQPEILNTLPKSAILPILAYFHCF